jgi:hypothetical protein
MDVIVLVIGGALLNSSRVLATLFQVSQSYRQLWSQTDDQVIIDQYTICRSLPIPSWNVVPKCTEHPHLILPEIIGEPWKQLREGCTSGLERSHWIMITANNLKINCEAS